MAMTLRQARLMRDLTQKQMAEILDVHAQTYSRIEHNPDRATVKMAKVISKELGIDYNEIFFGRESSLTRDLHQNNIAN